MGLAVGAGRGTYGHVQHTGRASGHDAHHDRARDRRRDRLEHRPRRRRPALSRSVDSMALGQLDCDLLGADRSVGDARDVGDRHLQSGHHVQRHRLQRFVQLMRGHTYLARLSAAGVEPARVLADGLVSLGTHVRRRSWRPASSTPSTPPIKRRRLAAATRGRAESHRRCSARLASGDRAAEQSRSRPSRSSIAAARSLWATGLAIRRAVHSTISSRTMRSCSRKVVPVAVRSTIASTMPVSGASSTDPLTSTISAWRPVSSR